MTNYGLGAAVADLYPLPPASAIRMQVVSFASFIDEVFSAADSRTPTPDCTTLQTQLPVCAKLQPTTRQNPFPINLPNSANNKSSPQPGQPGRLGNKLDLVHKTKSTTSSAVSKLPCNLIPRPCPLNNTSSPPCELLHQTARPPCKPVCASVPTSTIYQPGCKHRTQLDTDELRRADWRTSTPDRTALQTQLPIRAKLQPATRQNLCPVNLPNSANTRSSPKPGEPDELGNKLNLVHKTKSTTSSAEARQVVPLWATCTSGTASAAEATRGSGKTGRTTSNPPKAICQCCPPGHDKLCEMKRAKSQTPKINRAPLSMIMSSRRQSNLGGKSKVSEISFLVLLLMHELHYLEIFCTLCFFNKGYIGDCGLLHASILQIFKYHGKWPFKRTYVFQAELPSCFLCPDCRTARSSPTRLPTVTARSRTGDRKI
ncbi:hypothetical protein KSP40_PGU010063 [Platanthera guangdongensis]|uniref:Uncharacterized protein n=1 Tax=Platanthera guangdongensis TaxID=2320717 RepID=A0ABR2LF96_9ASPA